MNEVLCMSKRKESKKTAVFALEPDGFSIHTFELAKKLAKHEYHEIKRIRYTAVKKRLKRSTSIRSTKVITTTANIKNKVCAFIWNTMRAKVDMIRTL